MILLGLCPQCHRDEQLDKEKKKWRLAFDENHKAVERLFKILGDKEPTTTCEITKEVENDGTIIFTTNRLYVNNTKLYETTELGDAKLLAAYDADKYFLENWIIAKERFVKRCQFIDAKWTPPIASGTTEDMKEAYEGWIKTSNSTLKVADEFRKVEREVNEENSRRTEYLYKRYKVDPQTSTRGNLPYREAINQKLKSRLRKEIKEEDLPEEDFQKMDLEKAKDC
jgi:hypothetical protein